MSAIELRVRGRASMPGAASGAVSGLVAVTPACGSAGVGGALVIALRKGSGQNDEMARTAGDESG